MRSPIKNLESFIFASRWIQAPLYIGRIVARVVYCWLLMVIVDKTMTQTLALQHQKNH